MSKGLASEVKKRIDESRKADPNFTELDLSQIKIGKFTPEINALIQKHKNIEVLHLVQCGLTSLEGFPKGNFAAIDFTKNELTDDSHLEVLRQYKELAQLIFGDNKIEKLETILPLKDLDKLTEIDFQNNPVASAADYRSKIFEAFPKMEYLDLKDKEGNQMPPEEGEFEDDGEQEDDYDEEDDQEFDDDDQEFQQEEQSEKPKKNAPAKKKK